MQDRNLKFRFSYREVRAIRRQQAIDHLITAGLIAAVVLVVVVTGIVAKLAGLV